MQTKSKSNIVLWCTVIKCERCMESVFVKEKKFIPFSNNLDKRRLASLPVRISWHNFSSLWMAIIELLLLYFKQNSGFCYSVYKVVRIISGCNSAGCCQFSLKALQNKRSWIDALFKIKEIKQFLFAKVPQICQKGTASLLHDFLFLYKWLHVK